MHLISWNPSNRSQFAHLSSTLQLEIVDIIEENDARTVSVTDIIPSDHINCFEWQYSNQNSLLAYGTTTGAVTVVNKALSTQVCLLLSLFNTHCHRQLRLNSRPVRSSVHVIKSHGTMGKRIN